MLNWSVCCSHFHINDTICSKSWKQSLNILHSWFFFCLSVCLDLDIWYDMLWCRYLIYTCSCLCGQDNISCTYVYIQLIDEFVLKAWKGNKNGSIHQRGWLNVCVFSHPFIPYSQATRCHELICIFHICLREKSFGYSFIWIGSSFIRAFILNS